jgi:hypothetical protein
MEPLMQAGNMSVSFQRPHSALIVCTQGSDPCCTPQATKCVAAARRKCSTIPTALDQLLQTARPLGGNGVVGQLLSRLHVRVYWSAFVLLGAKNASSAD